MSFGDNSNGLRSKAVPFSKEEIKSFGSTLVFAPHPDDESLACGGLIALLRSINNPVQVVFVSDGSFSHPGSVKFPAPVLAKLREAEALAALTLLDVNTDQVYFMGLKDGSVPHNNDKGFDNAVDIICDHLKRILPTTIIVPWRRDTHADHRACWQLVHAAMLKVNLNATLLEYPLWLWERGNAEDLPQQHEIAIRYVDISEWLRVKEMAINAHQSQVTRLIEDDPGGFLLSQEVIAHFLVEKEYFFV